MISIDSHAEKAAHCILKEETAHDSQLCQKSGQIPGEKIKMSRGGECSLCAHHQKEQVPGSVM